MFFTFSIKYPNLKGIKYIYIYIYIHLYSTSNFAYEFERIIINTGTINAGVHSSKKKTLGVHQHFRCLEGTKKLG